MIDAGEFMARYDELRINETSEYGSGTWLAYECMLCSALVRDHEVHSRWHQAVAE